MAFGMGSLTQATMSGILADAVLRQGVSIVVAGDDVLPPSNNGAAGVSLRNQEFQPLARSVGSQPFIRRRPRQINASAVADLIRSRRDHEMIDRMYIVESISGPEIVFDFVARRPGDRSGWIITDLPRGRLETDPRLAAKETVARFQADDAYRACLREEAEAVGIDPTSILDAAFAAAATGDGEGIGAADATTPPQPAQPGNRPAQFGEVAADRPDALPPIAETAPRRRWKEHRSEYNGPWHFLAENYGKENLTWPDIYKDRDLYFALKNNIKRNKVIPDGFNILDRVAVTDRKIARFGEEERKHAGAVSRALSRRRTKAQDAAAEGPSELR